MSYRVPTSRRKNKKKQDLNLIPILDSVFILVFFLLMSAQFVKIYEIGSDVPIVSDQEPPKDLKKPLALTVEISPKGFTIKTGVPAQTYKSISKTQSGDYDLFALHDTLVQIKKNNLSEETIVLEPVTDLNYEEIVKIMDAVRKLENTDDALFRKDKNDVQIQIKTLFSKIMFGNIMS
jgi:biopolymer transport protein ExbD